MVDNSTYSKIRRQERRLLAFELLGDKCVKCGSTDNLEFDHIDPTTKHYCISEILAFRMEKLLAELSKCQLLCTDCHREKTSNWHKTYFAHNRNFSPHVHGTARTYHELKCHCEPCQLAKRLYRQKLISYTEVAQ